MALGLIAAWDRDGEETYRELAALILQSIGEDRFKRGIANALKMPPKPHKPPEKPKKREAK